MLGTRSYNDHTCHAGVTESGTMPKKRDHKPQPHVFLEKSQSFFLPMGQIAGRQNYTTIKQKHPPLLKPERSSRTG